MTEIRFTIPGRLAGKGRPRATVTTGFVRMYTPPKTRSEELFVATLAKAAMCGSKPLEGPIWLDMVIVQTPPMSWPKKKRETAKWVTGKPDCDNICKLASDSMNGIVYADDSQIAMITMARAYELKSKERIEIKITALK